MEAETLARSLTDLLAPFLPLLIGGAGKERPHRGEAPAFAKALWSVLNSRVGRDAKAKGWAADVALSPDDRGMRSGFRREINRLFADDPELKRNIEETMARHGICLPAGAYASWHDVLGKDDRVIDRLEMVYLLRTGSTPEEVAERFGVDVADLFRLNTSYSLAGAAGLLREQGIENWLDRLDRNDSVLRRLDMVRLLRSGTPVAVIARAYGALEEYVERVSERFSRHGALGVLTEDDLSRFNAFSPPNIHICTYNLHGTHNDGTPRFRRIAGELARTDPHICAFQEVISGAGIEDTSVQIGRWMSSVTGYDYQSRFCYCHEFMEKYPEGVAVSLRSPLKEARTIDLTMLRDGLRPAMPRNALAMETEVFGHKIVLASVHLDHNADPAVRLAQGEKLVAEVQRGNEDAYCMILAGDFNDTEGSPVIEYMRSAGFVDAYRACHRARGNTYPAGDPRARIDYIFVRGRATVVSSRLLPDDPGLSDHLGVFAEIR